MNHIISAACRVKINEKEVILKCHRHVDIRELAHSIKDFATLVVIEEGFLDSNEAFCSRREAFIIADNAKQIQFADDGEREWQVLYSEHLW